MRITKMPVPLLIAAVALTGVTVIYVYLQAPPLPIHTDANFTAPLFGGVTYLWRGAAFQYIFSADYPISVTYGTPLHLIYLNGPLYNISFAGGKAHIIYVVGRTPLYVHKLQLQRDDGLGTANVCLYFKLVDVTPANLTIANLTIYLPSAFALSETLSNTDFEVVRDTANCWFWTHGRVIGIIANATHIIFRMAPVDNTSPEFRYLMPLPSPMVGKTIHVRNNHISGSYTVGNAVYTVMALPYLYFAITPQETTTLTIYVS